MISNSKSGRIEQSISYPVNIETEQANFFAKIGYLFPNDDFKSLALQLSGTYNHQNILIGSSAYNGKQLSGYANLIYQQEIGIEEENYFKLGASCQIDSVNESMQSSLVSPPINQ